MKRFLLVLVFLLLAGAKAQSADIFFAQAAAGGNTGANCANARAASTHVIGDDVAGNIEHLCGPTPITSTFTFLASGTAGNPITLKFETGAKLSQPFAPGNGLLNLNGKAWLVIDGGVPCGLDSQLNIIPESTCNGIIEATANGTNLANHQGTNPGVEAANTDNVEIKNIDIRNIYVRVKGPDGNPGDSLPAGIRMPNATNMHIHDIKGHDADWFFWSVQCSGSTSNIEIDHTDTYNINHGLAVGVCANSASNIRFHDNHVGAMVNWDDTLNNGYHHDGVHLYVVQVGGTITGVSIYNNLMDGDWGTFTSAHIFMEGSISATIFNNVFNTVPGQHMSNGSIYNINSNGSDVKNIKLYNNTFIYNGDDTNGSLIELGGTVDVRNNALILAQTNNGVLGYTAGSTGTWNFNAYASVTPGAPIFSLSGGGPNTTYTAWKNAGRDVNSPVIAAPPMGINTTTGIPSAGSPVVNAGTNLTALGISGLNLDRKGSPRPASGPWTIGAFNSGAGTPSLTMTPNPVNFGNVNVGSNSSPITITVTSNGSSTATLGSPVATFSDPQFSNVGTGTCVINQSLPVGSSCTIIIRFTPSSAGAKSGTMLAGANTSASINLSGTGISLTPVVSISPSPVAFGSVTTSTTSAAQTVTVSNTGTGTLNLANPFFVISGTNAADYSRTGGTCANSGTVAAASSCTLTMTFHPAATGAKTGVLTINGNATGTANLTGTGVSPATPIVTISPSPVAFGNQVQSTTSAATTVTVTNTGAATLTLATPFFVFSGANPTNFARSGGTCSDGGSIAASTSCTIGVTFTPNILGARSATLTINGNATGSVSVTGTGIAPATPVVTITPSPIAFGNQTQGTTSSALTITVSNTGSASLILNTPFFTLTGTNATDFVRTGGTCANGGTVVAAANCTVLLTFTPATAAAESATLNISGNVNGSAPITGTGVAVATTSMSATPTSWNFGNVPQGTTSTPKQFTLTNTGTTSLTLAGPPFTTFTGANSSDFMLGTGGGDTCSSGTVLTSGQTCTKTLQGVPSTIGAESATVTFNATTTTATASLTMTGTGTSSILITPRPVAFPTTTIGTTSAAQTATITNNGTLSVTLSTPFYTLTGTNSADFTKTGGTCANGTVLAPTVTCTVTLTFTPTVNGAETSTLTVNSATATNSVTVNGTGAIPTPLPGIGLSPSGGIAFGSQVVGTTSSNQTVTVSSTGTGNLTLSTPYFTLTGTNAADVTNTGGGSCANGAVIAPGSTCTIILNFNPAAAGARTANLNVLGDASASLGITGTGVAQSVTLTAAPSPVAFGNVTQSTVSATQTVTITNTGNITATLATPYYTLTGTNSADFANLGTGSCANGVTLAVAATCTIKLTFTPSLLTAETATLTVNGSLSSTVADSLTGTGVAPLVPSIALSPDPVAFPSTNVGATSTGITVTVSNNGSATLNLSTPFYTVSGANPSDFTRSAGTCANGGTVAVSASCTIVMNFAPAAAGSRTATLTINGNASKSVNMTGTGVATAAILTLTPNPLNYGVVIQGSSSITTVTLQNTGTAQTTLLTPFFSITGANASDFTRLGGTCVNGQILAINGSCTILVAFTPSTNTAETATLSVFGVSVTGTATLNGTGQARPNLPAPSVLIISKRLVRHAQLVA